MMTVHDAEGDDVMGERPPAAAQRSPALETTLLAEFLHRTANDYGSLLAALHVAASTAVAPAAEYLEQAAIRIRAAAALHRIMIPPLTAGVADVRVRLEDCCRGILEARDPASRTRLFLSAEPRRLDANKAWMITAAAAELIANAERHAFRGEPGDIVVALREGPGLLTLTVCDTGRGAGSWTSKRGGAGGGIVDALAAALGGRVERRSADCGTVVELTIPMEAEDYVDAMRRIAA